MYVWKHAHVPIPTPNSIIWVLITDLDWTSQTSYTASCNGGVSHKAPIGGIRIVADHSHGKQMQTKCIHDLCVFCRHSTPVYLQAQTTGCRWPMHQRNPGYFDCGKNPNTPIGAPCRKENHNGANSWISGLTLWFCFNLIHIEMTFSKFIRVILKCFIKNGISPSHRLWSQGVGTPMLM